MDNVIDINQQICDKNFDDGCEDCAYLKYDESEDLWFCELGTIIEYSEVS